MANIEAREILIKDLLSDKFLFRIPGYQRPFTWNKDNFDDLFEDIKQSMENNEENYFLGSIILQTVEQHADGSGLYDVVDGQQRITSLIILLAVIRDFLSKIERDYASQIQSLLYQKEAKLLGKKEAVRLLVWEKEQDFFKEHVLQEGGTEKSLNSFNALSEAKQNMLTAVNLFKDKFNRDGNLDEQLLVNMSKYILNNCVFAYVKTDKLTSAFRLFAVLNTRGLPLAASDLLKSHNIAAIPDNLRPKYIHIWENLEEELGRDELEQLIAFIRDIWVKEKAQRTMFEEYQDKIFSSGAISWGEEFIKYLQKIAIIYQEQVLNGQINLNSDLQVQYHNLISLMRDHLPSSYWIPAFLHFSSKFTNESKKVIFLQKLEKRYVVDWVIGYTPTQRMTTIYNIIKLIDASSNEDQVINDSIFDTSVRKREFITAIDAVDFYVRSYCKYILLRLDLSLSENANVAKNYKGIITVEHILPRNPDEKSEWMQLFDLDSRREWTNRLGNLVLLSRKKNSSANNRPFQEKKKSYFGGSMTDFQLTKEIDKFDVWDLQSVKSRHEKLLNRAIKLWL
ncbi:hypothetical protein MHOCP_03480 [Moorella humiferrea]|uniref:DUF262 domain-containing protein n=1 Tax=Neomoorella humiferrea TaxID=676965 RepID=UPI0030CFD268